MEEISLLTLGAQLRAGKELTEDEQDWLVKKTDDIWTNHPWPTSRFPRWKKYMSWVAGYQLLDYNSQTGKLMAIRPNRSRKLIFNKLKGFVRTLYGRLCADRPQMGTLPATDDQDDLQASEVGDRVIDGLSLKLGFKKTLDTAKNWMIFTNVAFIRVFWNEDDFGILDVVRNKEVDEQGQEQEGPSTTITEEGDIGLEALNPFNCRPDPLFTDPKKWRYFVFGDRVDAEKLEKDYDLEYGVLKDDDSGLYDEMTLPIGSPEGSIASGTVDQEGVIGRTSVKKELWTKDLYAIVAGKQLLAYGLNKYGVIPVFGTEDETIPTTSNQRGVNWNDSVIKDAIPIQREYNRQRSLASISMEMAIKVKVMAPLNSLVSKKQFTDENGIFIDFNASRGNPYQLKLDPLPAFFPSYMSDLGKELQDMFSLHEASFGQLPPRASHASGTLLSLLLEQDDVVLNPILIKLNDMLSDAWHLVLEMVQDNYNTARLLRYTGQDGKYAIGKFRGSDLKGNTDVLVTSQTGLPRSRPLRIEYLTKLREIGLIKDDQLVLELMEFGNIDKLFKDSLLHERKAYRENDLIFSDPNIDPNSVAEWVYQLEDHPTHIKIHMRDRLAPKFDDYTPAQKQAMEAHIGAHQAIIQQQQQDAMNQQAIAQQAGGAKNAQLQADQQAQKQQEMANRGQLV